MLSWIFYLIRAIWGFAWEYVFGNIKFMSAMKYSPKMVGMFIITVFSVIIALLAISRLVTLTHDIVMLQQERKKASEVIVPKPIKPKDEAVIPKEEHTASEASAPEVEEASQVEKTRKDRLLDIFEGIEE